MEVPADLLSSLFAAAAEGPHSGAAKPADAIPATPPVEPPISETKKGGASSVAPAVEPPIDANLMVQQAISAGINTNGLRALLGALAE